MILLAVFVVILGAGVLAGVLRRQKPPAATATATTGAVLHATVLAPTDTDPTCATGPQGVRQGAGIQIFDQSSNAVGAATLGPGRASPSGGCQWTWSSPLTGASSYQLLVAQMRTITISRATLAAHGWKLTINDVP